MQNNNDERVESEVAIFLGQLSKIKVLTNV